MKLTAPLNIITRPAQSITTDTIIINSLVDNGQNVVANISLPSDNNPVINRISLTLWDANSTPTYTTIGDWTQHQAEDQIASLIGGTISVY